MKSHAVLILMFLIFAPRGECLATDISGRVSLRWYRIDNRLNGDINAPALRLRLNAANLFNRNLNFYIYYRGEKDLEGNRITKSRLYDLRLSANRLPGGFGLQLGRINSSVVGAYGILDGISVRYPMSQALSSGVFWGTEPDLLTFAMRDEIKRSGLFFELDKGRRYQGALSFIHQTYLNQMDRLYFYFDQDIEFSKVWSFSHFAEVDLREKKNDVVKPSLHFTNIFADLRFAPSRLFNTTFTFSSRKEFKYLESMSFLPDSLFESAVSYSYGLRSNIRPSLHWRVYSSFRLGQRYDQAGYEKFAYIGLTNSHFFSNDMFINLRFAKNYGFYALSQSWHLSLERRLSNRLRILSTFYQSQFESKEGAQFSRNKSIDLVFIYNLSWRFYLYFKGTRSWGTSLNENRFFIELSYNLRKYNKKRREK